MFKVVPDQLRISDGWVRCGQCAEVFEAPEHLLPEPLVAAPAPSVASVPHSSNATGAAPAAPVAGPEVAATAEIIEQDADDEFWALPPGVDLPPPEIQPDMEPGASAEPGPADEVVPPASQEEPLDVLPGEPEPAPVSGFLTEPSATSSLEPGPAPDPALQEVSFVREAQRKALWQRPQIRRVLMAACAALLVLLGLQGVVYERDRIAAFEPRTRGLLQGLCVPLRCTVAPLRQIESIVVDSSSFKKVRDNVYQLSLTIKNTAPVALAMPSVELALTDTQDQPVLRRVLLPTDLGAAAVLAAGGEWSGSLPVGVADNTIAARIAGYRVLAFYP